MNLTVGDGFKFGCGFFLAAVVFYILVMVIFIVFAIVASLVGAAFTFPTLPR